MGVNFSQTSLILIFFSLDLAAVPIIGVSVIAGRAQGESLLFC